MGAVTNCPLQQTNGLRLPAAAAAASADVSGEQVADIELRDCRAASG